MSERWEEAYVATSSLLGASVKEIMPTLDDAGLMHAGAILRALRSPSRDVRAKRIATAVTAIARDVEEARFTWR
jgi:hypothetical protein